MRRSYFLIGLICAAAALVPVVTAQSSVGSTSCSDYRKTTDSSQQALYAAYLQAYADAHSPDPRFTLSDAALADDAKRVRDWCGKNGKRTYGDAVAAVVVSAPAARLAQRLRHPRLPTTKPLPPGRTAPTAMTSRSVEETGSCLQAVGAVRANELVRRCLKVSPATHPPCNTDNSCSMIRNEIRRGCALIGAQAPPFCEQYRDSVDQ